MLRLPGGKMSSRTGDIITAESLFDEVEERVHEKMKDTDSFEARNSTEAITVGAIKYSILKQAAGKDIIFDFAKSLSFEGDSGPYLQYAHTRAQSILMKAEKEGASTHIKKQPDEITDIEKLLYQFPEIVERACTEYEPHHIVTYLISLAGAFNSYYAKEKILDESDEVPYKLALTKSFQVTMKNGLRLLGIKVPDKM